MNFVKNILLLTILTGMMATIQEVHAVAHYGALLYNLENKHFVTLIGEKHTRKDNFEKNAKSEKHCIECFEKYLQSKENLIVEAGEYYHCEKELNEKILIHKLTKMSFSSENSKISSYDLRAEKCSDLIKKLYRERYGEYGCSNDSNRVLGPDILSDAQKTLKEALESLKLNKENYNDPFLELIAPMAKLLSVFCKSNDVEENEGEGYNYTFANVFISMFEVFLKAKNIELNYTSLSKFTLKDSDDFLYAVSDYGFIAKIGQAEKNKENITLYTGSLHSKNIKEKLEKIGYQTLFFKDKSEENNGFSPLSKEDFDQLFVRTYSSKN